MSAPALRCVCVCVCARVCNEADCVLTYGSIIALQHMDGRFLTMTPEGKFRLLAATEPRWDSRGTLPVRDRKDVPQSTKYLFPVMWGRVRRPLVRLLPRPGLHLSGNPPPHPPHPRPCVVPCRGLSDCRPQRPAQSVGCPVRRQRVVSGMFGTRSGAACHLTVAATTVPYRT